MSILNSQYPVMEMHGTQNTFLVLTDFKELITPSQVKALCDVNTGFNKDGLMTVCTSRIPEAKIRMKFFNFDGSMAEMCGNGIRCFAKYLLDNKLIDSLSNVPIDTDAGLLFIDITENTSRECLVKVNMGVPLLEQSEQCSLGLSEGQSYITAQIDDFKYTFVSMGNPHAVTFSENPKVDVLAYGEKIEKNEVIFPERTNVEFAKVTSESHIEMHVWERGAGITLACGTGACATFVAAYLEDKVAPKATVALPGGDLYIEWEGIGKPIFMTGEAVNVFHIDVESLEKNILL